MKSLVVLALLTGEALAEDPPEIPRNLVATDLMFVLPVDNYADDADLGIGFLGRGERRMGDKLSLVARLGPVFHKSNIQGGSLLMLTALGGMRYDLDPNRRSGTFFSMAIGVNHVRFAVEEGGVRASDSSTSLCLDMGGGFQVRSVQVRGTIFYTPHIGASRDGDTTSYLGLAFAIGYDIVAK